MAKIWRLTYKQYYGTRGNFWTKTVDYHDEDKFNREIKKLKDSEGTIEFFESTEKIDLSSYISSIMRDNQLDSLLVVADEKSNLYSNFVSLLEHAQIIADPRGRTIDSSYNNQGATGYSSSYLKILINEWEFLKKSDDSLVKKFFAKYRTYLLNYANDSYEWYETLLQVYNYADIKPVSFLSYDYDTTARRHKQVRKIIKDLTENQKNNFFNAKKVVKEMKTKEKKLKKNNEL
jgi:hypothetical protein